MAYDEGVAQRIREVLEDRPCIAEKKMFGGIAFMHSGKMCCGVLGEVLKAGVGPSAYADALSRPYTREKDFTGRPMSALSTSTHAGSTKMVNFVNGSTSAWRSPASCRRSR